MKLTRPAEDSALRDVVRRLAKRHVHSDDAAPLRNDLAAHGFLGLSWDDLGPASAAAICQALGEQVAPLNFPAIATASAFLSRPDVGDQARALGWVADPERVAIGYRTSTGQAYVECTGDRQEVALVHHGGRWVFTAMPDGPLAQGKWEAAPSVGQIELRESDGPWIPDRGEFALNLLLHAAELVGVMREAFVRTTDYAKQREQFGRPLASFQVVQHKLVDMVAELHALEALLEHAVDCLVMEEAQDIDLWTHAAAGLISEAGPRMLGECLHLHGAIGMTREFWVHVWMRRAVRLAGFGGSSKQHLHDVGVRVRAGSSLAVTLRQ